MVYLQFLWYVQKNLNKGLNTGRGNRRHPLRPWTQAGSCLKKYRDQGVYIDGCPPLEPFPLWALVDREDYTETEQLDRERIASEDPLFRKQMEKLAREFEQSRVAGRRKKEKR